MFSLTDERREMVEATRMGELLAAHAVENPEAIETVKLSNKSFAVEAAAMLAATLSSFTNVVNADLADVIAGRPEDEALQVLQHICDALRGRRLQTLDLSDNALGAKGIHACRGVLEGQDDLHTLLICNNGLSAEAAQLVAELLLYRAPTKVTGSARALCWL
jgi:Ran GTPase-activating protein (RanGAP) involved in mRNA processing and transport